MIKVLLRHTPDLKELSIAEIEKEFNICWLPTLQFQTLKISQKVVKRSALAMQKKEYTPQSRWLGIHYQKELAKGYLPKITIQWIDEKWGFGVFAVEDIPAGRFVGEYTGQVRKRGFFTDTKNNYCFEYSIGNWERNPFVIDAERQGNHTRFINHSSEPNLEPFAVFSGDVMHIILITKSLIKSGQQLCYDYGENFWKKRSKPLN